MRRVAGGHVEEVVAIEEDRIRDRELVCGLPEHVEHHLAGDDRCGAVDGRAVEQRLGRRLRRERERGKRVHDQVDPEHLHGGDRRLVEAEGSDDRERDGDDVDRQLKLKELGDGGVDVAAPLGGDDDGGEVVVEQHDVARILGDLSARDAHREAHVRALQRGRIVRAVASHRHHLPVGEDGDALLSELGDALGVGEDKRLAEAVCERELVVGRGARKDPQVRPHLVKLLLHELRLAL
mmetsp:Transcript_9641/g.21046  ORF Transcript_9641/g.21046 Transcript_9641/m.21046 type:complete len:237 (+) Transcript_9641:671-1381(+)